MWDLIVSVPDNCLSFYLLWYSYKFSVLFSSVITSLGEASFIFVNFAHIIFCLFFSSSRKLLCIKVTPDLHTTYSKNGGNLGLVLKMKNKACISILLTKHVKYTYLYLFKICFIQYCSI